MLSINKSSDETKNDDTIQLTRSYVIDQLQKLGYEKDFLPDSVIDAFIQEINSEFETEQSISYKDTDVTEPLDEFSFESGEAICRNSNNQIIIKNSRQTRDISQMMERLDAIDLTISDDCINDDLSKSIDDSYLKQDSYNDDFTNMVLLFTLNSRLNTLNHQ